MSVPNEHLLHVVMNGQIIGDVQRTGPRRIRLLYSDARLRETFTPLSVSMPGSSSRYNQAAVEPWLTGLLPDRPETLRQWRRQFAITDNTVFSLLRHVGEDVAGAAQFVRPERIEAVLNAPGVLEGLDGPRIADMMRRTLANLPPMPAGHAHGKFSLAGAQAKIALHRIKDGWSDPSGSVPSTHIVKPAIPGRPDQDLVEAVTLRAAANLGLRVAHCWIEEFADERAIVVARFDRVQRPNGRWVRVHQEDVCQALGLSPTRKYESQGGPTAATVASLVRRVSHRPDDDLHQLAQALVFNWLTCGTDAHARNYSLLLSTSTVRLSPLYDLNSYLAYGDGAGSALSMSVAGTFEAERISAEDWVRFAPALLVDPEWLREEIERQRGGVLDALGDAASSDDIAAYDSRVVARLLANAEKWLARTLTF